MSLDVQKEMVKVITHIAERAVQEVRSIALGYGLDNMFVEDMQTQLNRLRRLEFAWVESVGEES
jgi:hypothetical protein